MRLAAREPDEQATRARFPFSVPAIRALAGETLCFDAPVTFFVGENGSGKSTLLEALACAARCSTVGSNESDADTTLDAVRQLASHLRLSWAKRNHRGFFLRSEDFFGFVKRIRSMREGLEADLARVDVDLAHASEYARTLAKGPYHKELGELRRRYGEDLDHASHGESFFTLFRARFVPGGLYLMDEPEAPLSPLRRIALIGMLRKLVEQHGAQFIIATHCPMLMAYPGAQIILFEAGRLQQTSYTDLEYVQLTRDFLAAPDRFLRKL